jgi:hypothetical protein
MSEISNTGQHQTPPEAVLPLEPQGSILSKGGYGEGIRFTRLEAKIDKLSDNIYQAIVDFH